MAQGRRLYSRFPSAETIAEGIARLNPGLSYTQAKGYASVIIAHNEAERFEAAWRVAGEALSAAGEEEEAS